MPGHESSRYEDKLARSFCGSELENASTAFLRHSKYRNGYLDYSANQNYIRAIPCRLRGVSWSSRHVGAGGDGPLRRQCEQSCRRNATAAGEIVWSWRRDPGVYPVRLCGPGNGDNKGRSPGRARISRKPIARGRPGCLGCTCQTRVRLFTTHCTRWLAGAVGARSSLRPLFERGTTRWQTPGKTCRGNAKVCRGCVRVSHPGEPICRLCETRPNSPISGPGNGTS